MEDIRDEFILRTKVRDFAGMVMASNPTDVRKAIRINAKALDEDPFPFFMDQNAKRLGDVYDQLSEYFGVPVGCGVISHSTTFALAQIITGVKRRPGQEFLSVLGNHEASAVSVELRNRRDGITSAPSRPLYASSRDATVGEILENLAALIKSTTRLLVLTWVSSADGVKLPVAEISRLVAERNAGRPAPDRLLFLLDGVHGFGTEDTSFAALGCDFFAAGCHKSMFGPRGTAVLAGKAEAWPEVVPMLPTLSGAPAADRPAQAHLPGGVRAHEHFWALNETFQFHRQRGRAKIAAHVRALATQLKTGLDHMDGVTRFTPMDPAMSSGIVCFDFKRFGAASEGVARLLEAGHLVTQSGADPVTGRSHVRVSVSAFNTPREIAELLASIDAIQRGDAATTDRR